MSDEPHSGDVLLAIDELDDFMHRARPAPLIGFDVRIDRQAYLALVSTIRACARSLTDFERGQREAPVSDALDELERLGVDSPRVPLTSQHRVVKEEVFDVIDRMRASLPGAMTSQRDAERAAHTRRVDLGDPQVPTLQELVGRVAGDRLTFVIARDGRVIAELGRPVS